MKRIITLLLCCTLLANAFAQTGQDTSIADISDLQTSIDLMYKTGLLIDSNRTISPSQALQRSFIRLQDFNKMKKLLPEHIAFGYYLRTTVVNKSNGLRNYLYCPGYYFDSIALYMVHNGVPEAINREIDYSGYRRFSLAPGEQSEILVYFEPSKVEFNKVIPVIVSDSFAVRHKIISLSAQKSLKNFSYILSGTLLMMILFMLSNFIIARKKEFLYNFLYSICMFLLVFFNTYALRNNSPYTNLYFSYIDFMLLVVGNLFYMEFSRHYLETKTNYRRIDFVLKQGQRLLSLMFLAYTYLNFFSNSFELQLMLENLTKFVMLGIGVMFIVLAAKATDPLLKYIAAGNISLVLFSAISLAIIWLNINPTQIFLHSLFYYYIGLVLELFFFLLGLNYKNRRELIRGIKEQEALKLEAEKKEFETQLAIIQAQQEERNRISADMHDDLGAGMTTIRLYSELAKHKLGNRPIPEIDKISSSANELLTKMNAIIWSMSSSNDSLGNMTAYIRAYALEYFEGTGIDCRIEIPENLPNIEVAGKIRRNVFLVVKEALNNALKHAQATVVSIRLVREDDVLSLYIQDNGVGINFDALRPFSNGLTNMKKRMNDVDIDFSIENKNGGTLVILRRKVAGFNFS